MAGAETKGGRSARDDSPGTFAPIPLRNPPRRDLFITGIEFSRGAFIVEGHGDARSELCSATRISRPIDKLGGRRQGRKRIQSSGVSELKLRQVRAFGAFLIINPARRRWRVYSCFYKGT